MFWVALVVSVVVLAAVAVGFGALLVRLIGAPRSTTLTPGACPSCGHPSYDARPAPTFAEWLLRQPATKWRCGFDDGDGDVSGMAGPATCGCRSEDHSPAVLLSP